MKCYVYNNIPTANNSQPPIFSLDITAGQLDSDDDDSTEYDEVSSDNDYSIDPSSTQRLREKYDIKPVLTFCNNTHQAQLKKKYRTALWAHDHTIPPSLLPEDRSLDADYPDYSTDRYCHNPRAIVLSI